MQTFFLNIDFNKRWQDNALTSYYILRIALPNSSRPKELFKQVETMTTLRSHPHTSEVVSIFLKIAVKVRKILQRNVDKSTYFFWLVLIDINSHRLALYCWVSYWLLKSMCLLMSENDYTLIQLRTYAYVRLLNRPYEKRSF